MNKKTVKTTKNKGFHTITKVDNLPADANWGKIVDLVTPKGIREMVDYYGKDVVLNARKHLTVGEVKARFGI